MVMIMFKKLSIVALLSLVIIIGLGACASTSSDQPSPANKDPFESFNRAMFAFNNGVDWILLKPVAKAYKYVVPTFVEDGISNFFSNLLEVPSLFNSGLQGKGKKSLSHTGRLLVNSTIGLLGFIDVAKYMGLQKMDEEDFGQTLATWGLGSGPYVVLPFLGPSTIRDGAAIPVNSFTHPISYVNHDLTRYSLIAVDIIETRASLLDTEKLITGDRYIFIRDAYLQRREFLINDGKVDDSFGESLEGEDF